MAAFVNFRLMGNKYLFLLHQNRYRIKKGGLKRFCTVAVPAATPEVVVALPNGRNLTISTGKYARFADGSAVATLGDTAVMVTTVSKQSGDSKAGFLPLTVDYKQKAAAAGRIPTNFFKRELGASEQEILASRRIDRSVRPLFPNEYCNEIQIICNMLAIDGYNDPEIVAINAASAALAVSDIPWNGPVGAVRLGMNDKEILINPTRREIETSCLNLIVTASKANMVIMLEGSADNIIQQDLMKAIKVGVKECQSIIRSIESLQAQHGKTKRDLPEVIPPDAELVNLIKELAVDKLREIFTNYGHDKVSRDVATQNLKNEVINSAKERHEDLDVHAANSIYSTILKEVFRSLIFENNIRCDGRQTADLRKISCQVNLFKPLHGSALFQRGQTQVLSTVTLDSLESALKMDTSTMLISGLKEKNFYLHYDFPPYATNETGRTGAVKRREVGHGALAERGLKAVLPKDYPFTVRLTSEVLESNGSSSMASVCAGSMALLDAGVPITSPAAGVAYGLVTKYDPETNQISDYRILTDILGIEDYLGDMDFKIAGTKKGINSIQADIKLAGVPLKIVMEIIQESYVARSEIINIMKEAIDKPRQGKENMPVTEKLEVPAHKRGKFLGIGGLNLKKILVNTGVNIYPQDENFYTLFAPNAAAMEEAKEIITKLLEEESAPQLDFGGIYKAKVVEIRENGVMVTLYPNMSPAFLHNSQLDYRKIHHPSALGFEVGHEFQVKYFGRDPVSGSMRLSRKVLQDPVSSVPRNLLET